MQIGVSRKVRLTLPERELDLRSNAAVIIGANGSGKSRMGAWIEQNNMEKVHRIGAQRSLVFGDYIHLKSLEQAENALRWGYEAGGVQNKQHYRWQGGKLATALLSDYDAALSALLAKKNVVNDEFVEMCKRRQRDGQMHCDAPYTVVDQLLKMWSSIFPQRCIIFDDAKITASYNPEEGDVRQYKGNEMSDGERVALYLLAQCLCVPNGCTIVIDEPELHLHRSIMNRLWSAIECARQDCLFVYITHDTQFAAGHQHATKIWVKSYDGSTWDWDEVADSDLPEGCLLDILGNRKTVLFVEGDAGSLDVQMYRAIYRDYYVVPRGGCREVVVSTKAMRTNQQLHHLQAFGLVDRDYRTEAEVQALKQDGVFTLEVAEVENLFCVEELMSQISLHQGFTDSVKVNNAKGLIISRFEDQLDAQIYNATIAEAKHQLSIYDISGKTAEESHDKLVRIPDRVDISRIREQKTEGYKQALDSKDLRTILSVFNQKGLSGAIGSQFGISSKGYPDLVLRLLKSGTAEDIIRAVTSYLPTEIPING